MSRKIIGIWYHSFLSLESRNHVDYWSYWSYWSQGLVWIFEKVIQFFVEDIGTIVLKPMADLRLLSFFLLSNTNDLTPILPFFQLFLRFRQVEHKWLVLSVYEKSFHLRKVGYAMTCFKWPQNSKLFLKSPEMHVEIGITTCSGSRYVTWRMPTHRHFTRHAPYHVIRDWLPNIRQTLDKKCQYYPVHIHEAEHHIEDKRVYQWILFYIYVDY
mmetsp:Transcript_18891/g.30057  ORF Transcript_18891/g.30057 Transcript_18891/m.30057 type:complete len:213 (-) Transcript_18891:587-1225(-)